ncbi:hypothetical protein IscW_ISCW018278 [Ixodes scapularis]|uniref:Uncharacterized protein n=1 Tax=Ixodes scapularis TaxID=6945 RepID=B7PHF0_IXOSC|nr:hypothetical protein IscW_ISCW018278 [Ixodes scapularis]|eukprot:XP_002402749.1 hypothetical protein IscW_ISCW018278 [Ixodes scapularis]
MKHHNLLETSYDALYDRFVRVVADDFLFQPLLTYSASAQGLDTKEYPNGFTLEIAQGELWGLASLLVEANSTHHTFEGNFYYGNITFHCIVKKATFKAFARVYAAGSRSWVAIPIEQDVLDMKFSVTYGLLFRVFYPEFGNFDLPPVQFQRLRVPFSEEAGLPITSTFQFRDACKEANKIVLAEKRPFVRAFKEAVQKEGPLNK